MTTKKCLQQRARRGAKKTMLDEFPKYVMFG